MHNYQCIIVNADLGLFVSGMIDEVAGNPAD